MGQVGRELLEKVGEVGCKGGLADLHEEAVRKAPTLHPVQGGHPISPLLREGPPPAAEDLVPGPADVRGPHLEAGGKDHAVDLVLDAGHDQAAFGDAVDTLPVGVDELDVGPVERREVLVVEGRPLAEHLVIGLELLGDLRVFHQVVDPRADLVHLVEVGQLHHFGNVDAPVSAGLPKASDHLADEVGPTVINEVFGLGQARNQAVEILHALLLPARIQAGGPPWFGGLVAAHVH